MKHLLFIVCIAIGTNTLNAQCENDLCRILLRLNIENTELKSENRRIKAELQKQKAENSALKVKLKQMEEKNLRLQDTLANYRKNDAEIARLKKELERKKTEIEELNQKSIREGAEISRLRQDSSEQAQKYDLFRKRNLVLESGTVIPYNIELGPIPISKQDDFPLDVNGSMLGLFNELSAAKEPQKIAVEISIQCPKGKRAEVTGKVLDQMRRFCPNCKFSTIPIDSSKWQIFIKLINA